MIQHTVTYMMSGCLLPPHLISEMFYRSTSVRYTHNPLLHMVTPMRPYWGSATQMQPTGGYQDAEDQTNRDGQRWPTASYWQMVLLQWLPAPVLALRWYSMGFLFSLSAHTYAWSGSLRLLRCKVKQLHQRILLKSAISIQHLYRDSPL